MLNNAFSLPNYFAVSSYLALFHIQICIIIFFAELWRRNLSLGNFIAWYSAFVCTASAGCVIVIFSNLFVLVYSMRIKYLTHWANKNITIWNIDTSSLSILGNVFRLALLTGNADVVVCSANMRIKAFRNKSGYVTGTVISGICNYRNRVDL